MKKQTIVQVVMGYNNFEIAAIDDLNSNLLNFMNTFNQDPNFELLETRVSSMELVKTSYNWVASVTVTNIVEKR